MGRPAAKPSKADDLDVHVMESTPQVLKQIEFACGCVKEVTVRPRESRMYLRVGQRATCGAHGVQEIVAAEEIEGNVPLLVARLPVYLEVGAEWTSPPP